MKYILLILITISSFAFQSNSAQVLLNLGELNGSGSSGNTLGEDRIANLDVHSSIKRMKSGDYIKLHDFDEYLLKTQSRNLIIENFNIIDRYKTLAQTINIKKIEDIDLTGEISSSEVIEMNEISVEPFEVDDF